MELQYVHMNILALTGLKDQIGLFFAVGLRGLGLFALLEILTTGKVALIR